MHAVTFNDVRYYNLTQGQALPEWISQKRQKEIKKKKKEGKIELIQDLSFDNGSPYDLAFTSDGNYLWVSGEYPAQIRCYELPEVTMKFSRNIDSAVVRLCPLSSDYRKIALLERERWVELHAQGGRHCRFRIPKEGRDMKYDARTSCLVAATSSPSVYLFDLDSGKFQEPLTVDSEAANVVSLCPAHPLLAVGCTNGKVETFDMRAAPSKPCGVLEAAMLRVDLGEDAEEMEITQLSFDESGMNMLVGTSEGVVGLFDIRKNTPLVVKDHNNALPVQALQFHKCWGKSYVISADTKGLKVWDKTSGTTFTTIDTTHDLFNFAIAKAGDQDSGLILATTDMPAVNVFFVPQLGPAPPWCSYLEGITEEMEETMADHGQYDEYKFVTREELERLGLTHYLTGNTDEVQPYMHGFYIDLKLYRTAKSLVDPVDAEKQRKERVLAKKQAEDRITFVKKKWNLLKEVEKEKKKAGTVDSRFADKMANNEKFRVDEKSEAFLKLHPHLRDKSDAFRIVEDEGNEELGSDDGSNMSEDIIENAPRKRDEPQQREDGRKGRRKGRHSMFELKEGRELLETAKEGHIGRKRERQQKLTMEERLKRKESRGKVTGADGGAAREISFESRRRQRSDSAPAPERGNRPRMRRKASLLTGGGAKKRRHN